MIPQGGENVKTYRDTEGSASVYRHIYCLCDAQYARLLRNVWEVMLVINETALCKLISESNVYNIVNLGESGFQYCNGFMVVECSYEHKKVMAKLLSVGAIGGKELAPRQTRDLTELLNVKNEVDAVKTDYIRLVGDGRMAQLFKITTDYYAYDKTLVNVFENVAYRAYRIDKSRVALRAYEGDKFVGAVSNMRINKKTVFSSDLQEIIVNSK